MTIKTHICAYIPMNFINLNEIKKEDNGILNKIIKIIYFFVLLNKGT